MSAYTVVGGGEGASSPSDPLLIEPWYIVVVCTGTIPPHVVENNSWYYFWQGHCNLLYISAASSYCMRPLSTTNTAM